MRRITAFLASLLLLPAAAYADAQFSAEDIIRHFKKNAATRIGPAPDGGSAGARPVAPDDDDDIKLPLTGAKRAVKLGRQNKAKAGTTIGKRVGTTVGTTVGASGAGGGLNLLITFESGSDQLTQQAMRNLDAFAEALRSPALATFVFEVQGHTDAKGSDAVNMRLSQRRAESVVSYLVRRGIATDRLLARGYGETRPIMSDPNHPNNRRVETRRIR